MRVLDPQSLTERKQIEVLEELARITKSDFFRASRRCCGFLNFSVQYVLDGRSLDELKERTIGIEVFQKKPDYDTAQDNIVRVTANEVRKRLAQYYATTEETGLLSIHLQTGSYAVYFEWRVESPALTEEPPQPVLESIPPELVSTDTKAFPRWLPIACMIAIAVATLAIRTTYSSRRVADIVQAVWGPILESPQPAVISIAQPYAYRSSSDLHRPLTPGDQVVALPDAFVGIGDAFAMADIVRLLSERGKELQLIPSNSTPSHMLLAGPMILIGNRSNKWSQVMLEDQRFYFGPHYDILDRSNPGARWGLEHLAPDWKTDEDFAIVSRFINPASGQPVIVIAGITIYGTQAAGNFVTNPALLAEAFRKAPIGWQHKNFQFVLHTKIIGDTPERPTVIAWNISQ